MGSTVAADGLLPFFLCFFAWQPEVGNRQQKAPSACGGSCPAGAEGSPVPPDLAVRIDRRLQYSIALHPQLKLPVETGRSFGPA